MIFSVPTAFSATPKIGGACTKINQFFESKSTLLVCVNVKGKKAWRKATSAQSSIFLKEKNRLAEVAKVVPTPSSSPAPIANQDLNIQNINLAKSNGTYYQDTSGTFSRFCQSSPMISALQTRNQQQWQDVAPGLGWFSSPDNCFQPWTIYSATQDQILRWRVTDGSGYWQVFSQEFKGNKLPAQSTVAPTPTVTVAPTVAPISTPTPSATATRAPIVAPTVAPISTPTPSATATLTPTVSPTPSALPSSSPTPSALPSSSPTPSALPSSSPTPSATATPTPTPTLKIEPIVITYWTKDPWTITGATASVGTPIFLGASGGYQSAKSFSVTGTNCVLSANQLSAKAASTCVVVATDATISKTIKSAPQTFSFIQPVDQQPLVINYTLQVGSSPGFTASHLDVFFLSTSGGSGSGNVYYTLASNPYCQFNNGLTASRPTTCVVTARKGAMPGYNEAVSSPTQFTFTPFSQSPLIINYKVTGGSKAESMAIGEFASLESTFTQMTGRAGALSFSVSGDNCSLGGGWNVTASTSTTCIVTATITAHQIDTMTRLGTGYLRAVTMYYSAITSVPVSFVFDFRDQAPLVIFSPITTQKAGESGIYVSAYGGSGTGTITYSIISGSCLISGSARNEKLTATGVTSCVVVATKAASPIGYRTSVSSQPVTFYFTAP